MATRRAWFIVIWTLLSCPAPALASTHGGAYVDVAIVALIGLFAGIGAAVASRPDDGARSLFVAGGLCVALSCLALFVTLDQQPFIDLISEAFRVTVFVSPIPFIVGYGIGSVMPRSSTKQNDDA